MSALVKRLHAHKYMVAGPARSYQLARKQAVDNLVDKAPFDENATRRVHERDIVRALSRVPFKIPPYMRAVRPDSRGPLVIVESGRGRLNTEYGPVDLLADARIDDGKLMRLAARLPKAALKSGETQAQGLTGLLDLTTTGEVSWRIADQIRSTL